MRSWRGFAQGAGGMLAVMMAITALTLILFSRKIDDMEAREMAHYSRYLAAHDTTHLQLRDLDQDMDSVKDWTRP